MTVRVELGLHWRLHFDDASYELEPLLFDLLDGVERGGHLNFAASAAGVSYRHAWGLIRTWHERFDEPLITLRRGRGASLTRAGRALLDARANARKDTATALDAAAGGASERIVLALERCPTALRIASSSNELVNRLVDALHDGRRRAVLELTGSQGALHRYRRGDVDIAGFHLPMGELGRPVSLALLALLDDARDRVFLLEFRVLGLMSRAEHPVRDIEVLHEPAIRFVNRQPGSGTRLMLDSLLGMRGIPPGDIAGYRDEEYTHSAVAATVASGRADAGLGTSEAAERFGLVFSPVVQERFYLCTRRAAPRAVQEAVAGFADAALEAGRRTVTPGEARPGVALLRRLHNAL